MQLITSQVLARIHDALESNRPGTKQAAINVLSYMILHLKQRRIHFLPELYADLRTIGCRVNVPEAPPPKIYA